MAIKNRKLAVGTKLVAKYKGEAFTCTVVKAEGPKHIAFRVEPHAKLIGGVLQAQIFNSPSKAGQYVMGGIACNGWRYWSLADGDGDSAAQAAPAPEPDAPAKASAKKARPKRAKTAKAHASA